MNEESRLLNEAQLGIETEAFLESYVGRYIAAQIVREIEEAHEALERASTMDEVRIAQNAAWRAKAVQGWLLDAIANGKYAEQELNSH